MKISYVMMFLMVLSCTLIVGFVKPENPLGWYLFSIPIAFAIIAYIFIRRDNRKERELEKERGRYWRWY